MFAVTEEQAATIRAAFEQRGELSATIELRRMFPGIKDGQQARECVRIIAGWKALPAQAGRRWRLRGADNQGRGQSYICRSTGRVRHPRGPERTPGRVRGHASPSVRIERGLRGRPTDDLQAARCAVVNSLWLLAWA
jgi:hypothetical protein